MRAAMSKILFMWNMSDFDGVSRREKLTGILAWLLVRWAERLMDQKLVPLVLVEHDDEQTLH